MTLDFLSKPLVLIVIVVIGGAVLGFGPEVEHLIDVIAGALSEMKPW